MDSRQKDIFDYSIRPTVDDILNGYNGTVFAYGQTGAGKSYTMMGTDMNDEEGRGVIPRIVEQIFASILASPSTIEYTVRVSYMEIYMERIRDLMYPANDNLPIHEEKGKGVYVKGLSELYVSSVEEVYEVMRRGGQARAVAATNMNQESSRSHSIFQITITQKNVETGSAKSGQLFLVDLAGSEKVGKTGASGQTLEEAKKINKSLSALGMVINSLTDGKSSHVPYRDSKLTRILQESLGGNSRTTLIINASPSSYNDAETLSTLRFGMRAKAIKNKARVNAELSPAELKMMLKKAQNQVLTFENYIANLEGEVQLWRKGEPVPQEQWTPFNLNGSTAKSAPRTPRPATPSRLQESRAETPVTERSSTPVIPIEKDERDEFLRRENELQDQLAEKESQIAEAEKSLKEAKEELAYFKEQYSKWNKDNERLTSDNNELNMQIERIKFEAKEDRITVESLKEANQELTQELDETKQQLLDAKISVRETSAVLDEKERKKQERMAKMMAGFDLGGEAISENEVSIKDAIKTVEKLADVAKAGEAVAPDDLEDVRNKLIETQGILRQAELSVYSSSSSDNSAKKREQLEARLRLVEEEYTELLERNLSEADVAEVKERLAKAYTDKQDVQQELVEDIKRELVEKSAENARLKALSDDLQLRIKAGAVNGAAPTTPSKSANGKTVAQQIAEFDAMKKSLMRDLQNRCERVVELEISLDETREQYNNVLKSSNNRAQQKKMAFLERNLEQLTHVQRKLVEQNGSLKKEVAIAMRKLEARNERIASLEGLLQDSQEKLTQANHKYVLHIIPPTLASKLTKSRFETSLMAVREKLDAVKKSNAANPQQGMPSVAGGVGSFFGSRIAKPLRGGGAAEGPSVPTISGLQNSETPRENKRTSWFQFKQ
jgi:kinesin family protein 5